MLTRRAFLHWAAAAIGTPRLPALAADDDAAEIHVELAGLAIGPGTLPTPILRVTGQDAEGGLRLAPGRTRTVRIRNASPDAMAFEWRGLRGAGALEQANTPVGPGQAGNLRITPAEGGTALLRAAPSPSHPVERGAAVAVVMPEAGAVAVDRDIVVLLEDWLLAADSSLRFGSTPPADAVLCAITVNGAPGPREVRAAPGSRLRLRFVNASAQRAMVIACTGARPMIAAIDGQPSELFAPVRNTVPIGPGARYDLLLDIPEGADAPVRFALKPTMAIGGKLETERDLLVISTEGTPQPRKPRLAPLPANPALPVKIPLEAARRVDLTFAGLPGTPTTPPSGWTVNGVPGPANDRPVLTVRRGDAVVLGLKNASSNLLPLRIGGHAVRLLHDRDDGWEPYWRDTLLLPPNGRSHVAFVADAEGHWPIDSGFDDLTRAGLSCVFNVTAR